MTKDEAPDLKGDGSLRGSLQSEIVKLHKEFSGQGPIGSKLYVHDEAIIVLMFRGHTVGEQTMLTGGGRRSVAQSRVDMSESARARLIEAVESHTGQDVVGFMSSSQQAPDLLSYIFVLRPTDESGRWFPEWVSA